MASNEVLEGWRARITAALAALGDEPLEFRTWTRHNPELTAHNGEVVTVVEAIVDQNHASGPTGGAVERFDEEALPFVRVRAPDGQTFVAECEELFSADPRWLEVYAAICSGFGVARCLGDFAGPYDVVESGTAEQLVEFGRRIAEFEVRQCAQHWNTPERFKVVAPVPGALA